MRTENSDVVQREKLILASAAAAGIFSHAPSDDNQQRLPKVARRRYTLQTTSMHMYRSNRTFTAFAEEDLQDLMRERSGGAGIAIRDEQEDYLLKVNRDEFVNHLVSRFQIPPLEIHADKISVGHEEMLIEAEMYPRNFHVREGQKYPRLVLTYSLPFSGSDRLLRTQPSTFSTCPPGIWVEAQMIHFDFIQFEDDPAHLRQMATGIVEQLVAGAKRVNHDLSVFNQDLKLQIAQGFDQRRQQLLERRNYLAALAVPIRATNKTAATYSAPVPKKINPITPRPPVTDKTFYPDPTMDDVTYQEILKLIHNVGLSFEKLPSTYTGKDEETLRDHLLLALAPNFQGAATGETFNKSGKTDILLRHEKSNLFIAECKFWRGPKSALETVTQLLAYLTWRDSKAAVILFVRNLNFSEVLSAVAAAMPTHPNYLGGKPATSETWLNYQFHVNGDKSREVKLAVLLFHFPPANGQEGTQPSGYGSRPSI